MEPVAEEIEEEGTTSLDRIYKIDRMIGGNL
jgi:hypothetical protein